jgi:DNA polymerase-3 subunit alpha
MGANAHELYARRQFVSLHEELDGSLGSVLGKTYGLIVFQEQVLQVLNIICGWDYGEAELLFNAMRKKDHDKMAAAKPSYIASGTARSYSRAALDTLWETLVPFADYSFNKSHATGYALLAYETAYLKAHYPKEYMCSLLSSVNDEALVDQYGKPTKKKSYLEEVKRMGMLVIPPDINESDGDWAPSEEGVRFGLASIKGVGEKAYAALTAKRPYKDFDDFLMRVPAKGLNSGVITALAKAGALDSLEASREALSEDDVVQDLTERAKARREDRRKGQTRFRTTRLRVESQPVDIERRREWELEVLGLALSASSVRLVLPPLDDSGWAWLYRALSGSPGDSKVTLIVSGQAVSIPARISLTDGLRSGLQATGIVVEETS